MSYSLPGPAPIKTLLGILAIITKSTLLSISGFLFYSIPAIFFIPIAILTDQG